MDADLNRIKDLGGTDQFMAALDRIINSTLTSDFWTITLPTHLETSSSQSPSLFAYNAAQVKLGASVLFSNKLIWDLLDPSLKMKKKSLERHHLFPRAWLESQGIKDLKLINQIANFALLEWPDNIDISDAPPVEYVFRMRERFTAQEWARMCELHALPESWEQLPYEEFLQQRRVLMAQIIRRGFEALS
ncbi:MAG TPA: hypothetical protein VGL94_17090 [Ktedonobacteraceae bacterium]|jgi:hypothetical protein